MDNKLNSPLHKRQCKDKNDTSQLQTIFQFLKKNNATAAMVSSATGIPHKNITRYKRDLEKAGKLWEIGRKLCKKTGFKAWYLTTNPHKAPTHQTH